eukprot:1149407-Pelagomonas_calceolata.AAC.1
MPFARASTASAADVLFRLLRKVCGFCMRRVKDLENSFKFAEWANQDFLRALKRGACVCKDRNVNFESGGGH